MTTPTPAPRAVINPPKRRVPAEKAFYVLVFLILLVMLAQGLLGLYRDIREPDVRVYYCDSSNTCTQGSAP